MDEVITRIEALVADHVGFSDEVPVSARIGDIRKLLTLALKLESLDRIKDQSHER